LVRILGKNKSHLKPPGFPPCHLFGWGGGYAKCNSAPLHMFKTPKRSPKKGNVGPNPLPIQSLIHPRELQKDVLVYATDMKNLGGNPL